MAISVLRKYPRAHGAPNPNYYIADSDGIYVEFVCDDSSDIANLPTTYSSTFDLTPRPGSCALDCDSSTVYVLSPARTWKPMEA